MNVSADLRMRESTQESPLLFKAPAEPSTVKAILKHSKQTSPPQPVLWSAEWKSLSLSQTHPNSCGPDCADMRAPSEEIKWNQHPTQCCFKTWPQTQQTTAAPMCWQNKKKFFCAQCYNCLLSSADAIPVFAHQVGSMPHLLQSYSRDELKEKYQILGFGGVSLNIGLVGSWKCKQKRTKTRGSQLTTKIPSFQPNSEGSRKWRYNKASFLVTKTTTTTVQCHH